MSEARLPVDLIEALQDLAEQPDPAPETFERVARWRRACGDADGAATWQTWSLLPPPPKERLSALATIWSALGQTKQAAQLFNASSSDTAEISWINLELLLQQGDLEAAAALQARLLQTPPTIPIASLLNLVGLWQESTRSGQALELLEPLLRWIKQRGEAPTIQVCLAVADLLEQEQRFDEAEPWWQRSHALQPQQAWPLMRLGHQAMRKGQPALALHYARQVLEREPTHPYAPQLQRNALLAMDATRSLAFLDGKSPSGLEALNEPPTSDIWDDCDAIALIGFADGRILQSLLEHFKSEDHTQAKNQALRLWFIASPDPLWFEQEARSLLEDQHVEIISWPTWESHRHAEIDLILEAIDQPPYWQKAQPPQ